MEQEYGVRKSKIRMLVDLIFTIMGLFLVVRVIPLIFLDTGSVSITIGRSLLLVLLIPITVLWVYITVDNLRKYRRERNGTGE